MDMHSAIERSCNTYFWATGLITDPEKTTEMVHYLGYGEKFDLPIPTQRFGTMPSPKWLKEKYDREWQGYDSANTSIGQGYVLINPMQLAVMPARLASGKLLKPRLSMVDKLRPASNLDADPEHLEFVRKAMKTGFLDLGERLDPVDPLGLTPPEAVRVLDRLAVHFGIAIGVDQCLFRPFPRNRIHLVGHAALHAVIDAEEHRPHPDLDLLTRLKKEKLRLKDELVGH